MSAPIFKCFKCLSTFQSSEKGDAPLSSIEEIGKLKQAIGAKEELFLKTKDHLEETKLNIAVINAWHNYSKAALRTNVWKVPDDLISFKSHAGHNLICKNCSSKSKKENEITIENNIKTTSW